MNEKISLIKKFIDETEKLYKKFRITKNLNLSKFEEVQEMIHQIALRIFSVDRMKKYS